jgi:hypothetical protein
MDSESIGDVKKALAGFPGLAEIAVIEHAPGEDEECLIAYVVPSGPGLDLTELHAYARKTLSGDLMPAAILAIDQIPASADGTVNTAALPLPELSGLVGRSVEAMLLASRINNDLGVRLTMADLFKAPTVSELDHHLDQMAATRK